jgi:hypothetical protein
MSKAKSRAGLLSVLCVASILYTAARASADAAAPCAPPATAPVAIAEVMRRMYVALKADDLAGFQATVSPDFYAFDGGARYTAESLVALIKSLHAAGKRFEWTVNDPEVHAACDLAWITYVNQGSMEDAAGKQPLAWLESGVLVYSEGRWRLRFFHSTRASKVP